MIFPFEEKFYREQGVDATFVGHPLADFRNRRLRGMTMRFSSISIAAKHWITIMPGSRMKEVRMNLPTILESAGKLGSEYEFLLPVAPTLARRFCKTLINQQRITLVRNRCLRCGIRVPVSSLAERRRSRRP